MISKELEDIIAKITSLTKDRKNELDEANNYAAKAKNYAEFEKNTRDKAFQLEQQIDKLQLAMRTVLNGEPSTIAVEPPEVPEEPIAREG